MPATHPADAYTKHQCAEGSPAPSQRHSLWQMDGCTDCPNILDRGIPRVGDYPGHDFALMRGSIYADRRTFIKK